MTQEAVRTTWTRRVGRHLPFALVLVGAIAIRVVVTTAYRPVLLFFDSTSYLRVADDPSMTTFRPIGYSLLLSPFRHLAPDTLAPIGVFQHVLGLAVGVAIYAFLIRRGLPAWGAVLATLPILFDPLQLVLEHYVLSDVVFEALLVAGCLLLLWNPSPSVLAVSLAGVTVAVSALVRGAGTFLLVVFLVALLCLRPGWKKVVAFVIGGLLPLGLYATAYHHANGSYALSESGPRFIYARVAPIVDCHNPALHLPSYERILCPPQPVSERPSSDYYIWGHRRGPAYHLVPPPGMTANQVLKDFSKRVIRAQPRAFTDITVTGFLRGFAPTRNKAFPGFPSRYWLFQDHYWGRSKHEWKPTADAGPAAFMTHYRKVLWTPGPVLGGLLVVSLLAALGVGRSRRSGDRIAIGLLSGACLMTLLTGVAVSGFSWRYQLPQIPLFPMAGALALAALIRGQAPGRPAPPPPLRPLERAAAWSARRVPALQRPYERGLLALLAALVAGVAAFLVVTVGAVGSGWFRADTAAVVGAGCGVLVAIGLLVAHRRVNTDLRADRDRPTIGA
jgi:hypothetical protein